MKRNYLVLLAVGLLVSSFVLFQLSGCGGGGGGPTPVQTTGILRASITDAPPAGQDFASVHITINKVVVVPAGQENAADNEAGLPVIATFPGGLAVEILNLHFLAQLLGSATVPAGSYTQVRLILAPNQPTLSNYITLTGDPTQKTPAHHTECPAERPEDPWSLHCHRGGAELDPARFRSQYGDRLRRQLREHTAQAYRHPHHPGPQFPRQCRVGQRTDPLATVQALVQRHRFRLTPQSRRRRSGFRAGVQQLQQPGNLEGPLHRLRAA